MGVLFKDQGKHMINLRRADRFSLVWHTWLGEQVNHESLTIPLLGGYGVHRDFFLLPMLVGIPEALNSYFGVI